MRSWPFPEQVKQVISSFDRIIIAVPRLDQAVREYQKLLGAGFWCVPDGAKAWLGLANVVLELKEQAIERPAIVGVVFASDDVPGSTVDVSNARQLELSICDGRDSEKFRAQQAGAQNAKLKVDHLVLRTADAEACINLFSLGLGIRLALDKSAPQWGGRMLFFRVGKLTLEIIETPEDKPEKDYFWGIAYQCEDISGMVAQLRQQGLELSDVRDGRKPGTKVATVKSHALGIPTMLIEPANQI